MISWIRRNPLVAVVAGLVILIPLAFLPVRSKATIAGPVTAGAPANVPRVNAMTKVRLNLTGDPEHDAQEKATALASIRAKQKQIDDEIWAAKEKAMQTWMGAKVLVPSTVPEADVGLHQSIALSLQNGWQEIDARKEAFAWCLDPQAVYRCVGYHVVLNSVIPNAEGWEAVIEVQPRLLSHRGAIVFTSDKCTETWQVSKTGNLALVQFEATENRHGIMVD